VEKKVALAQVGDIGEFELIKLLTEDLIPDAQTIVGVGDDCSVYEIGRKRYLLATCDMLIEDVHFSRKTASPFLIGCKAIASSLSDIAAMGGRPLFTMVAVGLPVNTPEEFALDLYIGVRSMCRDHGVALVGGDTVRSPDKIVIDVSMIGECSSGKFALRSGAKTGDAVLVTGHLGSSAAGLDLLEGKKSEDDIERRSELVEAHLAPEPRTEHGVFLVQNFEIHSMIDISDGFAGDLAHICEDSKLGARIWVDKIPVSAALEKFCGGSRPAALDYAISGGEDYELLFTLPTEELEGLLREWPEEFEIPLSHIGEMDKAFEGISLLSEDGSELRHESGSFEHFGKA
jgi:thiamine-monophosphate kinase